MQTVSEPSALVKPLRPYQHAAISGVRESFQKGHGRVVLVLPTGVGKTRTASEIARSVVARGKRVLWLAHRTELVTQSCQTLAEYGLRVGAISASSDWPVDLDAPVQVASIQTLASRKEHRPACDLIVGDECHHLGESAEEWHAVLADYPRTRILGLTATPERGDGSGLNPPFTDLVVGITVRQATEQGWLLPCEVVRPDAVLEPNHLAQNPLDVYRETCPGQQGFLFAKSVEEARKYCDEFNAAGIRSALVHAKTAKDDRAESIERFRRGEIKILHNVYIFTEGTDLPMAQVCILARGAGTPGIFLQMVGRVLRPWRGQTSATLIDLRGISHVHGMPEDERVYSLKGRGIALGLDAKCKVCGQFLGQGQYPCVACGYAPIAGEGIDGVSVVDGVPVAKYARMIAQGPVQRWETLIRWGRIAHGKGHKPGAVRHKWKAVYGEELPFTWFGEMQRVVWKGEADRGAPDMPATHPEAWR